MRTSVFSLTAVLVALAPCAAAADTSSSEANAAGRAAELYREGNALYDQGKFQEAEARYQAAWDIQHSFDVAGNLGNVEIEVHQTREAAEHLSYALEVFPLGEKQEKKQMVERRLAEAKKHIGTLVVSVSQDGADVYVDDRLIGRSPLKRPFFVDPGARIIEARFGGKKTSKTIFIDKGEEQRIALAFTSGPSTALLVAGGTVGLLGLASGATFAILANGKASDARAKPVGSDERRDLRDTQTRFANVSFWSFVGGGAVLAGTAIYALSAALSGASPGRPSGGRGSTMDVLQSSLRALPLIAPSGGGLAINARF